MPQSRTELLTLLFAAALLAGCGSVPLGDPARSAELKKFQAQSDVGQIYVCRSSSGLGLAIKPAIEVDGKVVAYIARSTYIYVEVAPGDHSLVAKTMEHDSKMPFAIAAGEQKFFQTWISPGFLSGWGIVDSMTSAEGKKCVSDGELVATEATTKP